MAHALVRAASSLVSALFAEPHTNPPHTEPAPYRPPVPSRDRKGANTQSPVAPLPNLREAPPAPFERLHR